MEDFETVEHFYGVYLLYCLNPKYQGHTYIGYTVDPNRRIKQHNKGKKFGGASKTNNRGPWSMVLIIHDFPNDISALRFEWAWQHPKFSRRLKHVSKKKKNEKLYDFKLRVLWEMLQVGPWNRLPLTIRWLNQEFAREFPENRRPPFHMPICYGLVISKKIEKVMTIECTSQSGNGIVCFDCHRPIENLKLSCLNPNCSINCHIICMSKHFLSKHEYIPIEGTCPKCKNHFLWGDIVKKYKGCFANINLAVVNSDGGIKL